MFENSDLKKLQEQLATMIALQRDLLAKLQTQNAMLTAIANFVQKNSADTPAFGAM